MERHVEECHAVYVQRGGFLEPPKPIKIGTQQTPFTQSPKGQMQATFQDTLHLLAWNGYGREAYLGSMACKQTWTDDRILFPKVMNMKFDDEGKSLIGIYTEKACWYPEDEGRLIGRVKHLIALGADPDISDENHVTPLTTSSNYYDTSMDIFNYLLTQKVRINGDPNYAWNPLSFAASDICTKKTIALLKNGADPNFKCKDKSILHLASMFHESNGENTETIQLLLKAGANPNTLDQFGSSPMTGCIEKGYIKYAKLFLEYGGIIEDTERLMVYVIENKVEASIKFLRQHGEAIPDDIWHSAIKDSDVPLVAMLLRCGACPITPVYGEPPLYLARYNEYSKKSMEVMKLLCNAGADVKVESQGVPLMNSAFLEYLKKPQKCVLDIIELLLLKGAKLPSKLTYKAMLALVKKEMGEFVELNRIIMKERFKK